MFSAYKKLGFLIDGKLKKRLFLIYLITILGTFLETLGIGIILPVLKIIVEGKDVLLNFSSNYLFLNKISDYLSYKSYGEIVIILLTILTFIFFIKTSFFLFLIRKQQKFAHSVEYELTKQFFNYYLNQDYSFHLRRNSSELFSNLTEEIRNFRLNMVDPFLIISTEIIFLIAITTLLITIEPLGSITIGLVILLISIIYIKFTSKRILNASKRRQTHEALKVQHLRQGLNGIKEIKISCKENIFLNIFDKHNKEALNSQATYHSWNLIPKHILEFIGVLGLSLMAIVLIRMGVEIKSLLPTLAVFVVATLRLLPSASKMIQAIGRVRYGIPSADLLQKEISEKKLQTEKNKTLSETKILKFNELRFEDVSFKYSLSDKKVLNKISFEIKKGDKIGITGSSGSGKSTLIDIFTGLMRPTDGKIFLNNKIEKLDNKNWYKLIGYTPQFIFLTDDTILRNIAFGTNEENLQLDEVKKAYEIAELKNYIENSEQGLETKIGESGIRLSGGQRQRIGIARAIYSNSEILILDESTSAIDIETEKKIVNNINSLLGKTVIIISHRLSTLRNCNKVFEINNGKLDLK
tara:strand:+ start:950 stop:2692 length:1743 start_codon:yes stop_codon:yes gene_type:complete